MKLKNDLALPKNWSLSTISAITTLNPTVRKTDIPDDLEVSFVPMSSVEAESGDIDVSCVRKFSEVKKGYTPFLEGDVLFAKITPCMENGKMAVVPKLQNGVGFGSTEFHVLRCTTEINPKYIYFYVSSKAFRQNAEHNMTGAVGQKRVTAPYLANCEIPIPPHNEQYRIVAKIEALFSELDKGIESFKTAREQLKIYRQALLKHAFSGKLTEQWRAENLDKLESAEAVLQRIQIERQQRYQQQLNDWLVAVEDWNASSSGGKKPSKPRQNEKPDKPSPEHLQKMWPEPKGWQWLQIGDFAFVTKLAGFEYTDYVKYDDKGDLPVIKAENAGVNGFKPTNYSKVDSNSVEHLKRSHINGGEILVVFVGAGTGNVAMVPKETKFFLGPNIGMVRPESKEIDPNYIELFLRSPMGKDMLLASVKAVAQPSISMGTIRQTPVILPCLCEQSEIVKRLSEKLSSIDHFLEEIDTGIQKSEALRQSILKKAFSGQLVPQDPNDEPASVLLERIRAEKAQANIQPARRRGKTA